MTCLNMSFEFVSLVYKTAEAEVYRCPLSFKNSHNRLSLGIIHLVILRR